MDTCVGAYDAGHQNSHPRGSASEPILVNHPTKAAEEIAAGFASTNFNMVLQQLIAYFQLHGWFKTENFGAIVVDLEDYVPGKGLEFQVAIFVSDSGLPKELQELFTAEGIPIHMAQAWRRDQMGESGSIDKYSLLGRMRQ